MPGCVGPRDPRSTLCTRHWRRLTLDERHQLNGMLWTIAAAALAGDQQSFEARIDETQSLLARLAPEMQNRIETPLGSTANRATTLPN